MCLKSGASLSRFVSYRCVNDTSNRAHAFNPRSRQFNILVAFLHNCDARVARNSRWQLKLLRRLQWWINVTTRKCRVRTASRATTCSCAATCPVSFAITSRSRPGYRNPHSTSIPPQWAVSGKEKKKKNRKKQHGFRCVGNNKNERYRIRVVSNTRNCSKIVEFPFS